MSNQKLIIVVFIGLVGGLFFLIVIVDLLCRFITKKKCRKIKRIGEKNKMIKKIIKKENVASFDFKDHHVLIMMPNADIVSLDMSGELFMKWFMDEFCPQYIKEHREDL